MHPWPSRSPPASYMQGQARGHRSCSCCLSDIHVSDVQNKEPPYPAYRVPPSYFRLQEALPKSIWNSVSLSGRNLVSSSSNQSPLSVRPQPHGGTWHSRHPLILLAKPADIWYPPFGSLPYTGGSLHRAQAHPLSLKPGRHCSQPHLRNSSAPHSNHAS